MKNFYRDLSKVHKRKSIHKLQKRIDPINILDMSSKKQDEVSEEPVIQRIRKAHLAKLKKRAKVETSLLQTPRIQNLGQKIKQMCKIESKFNRVTQDYNGNNISIQKKFKIFNSVPNHPEYAFIYYLLIFRYHFKHRKAKRNIRSIEKTPPRLTKQLTQKSFFWNRKKSHFLKSK